MSDGFSSNSMAQAQFQAQAQMEQSSYAKLATQAQSLRRRFEAAGQDERKLKAACQDFEAIFLGKLWEGMRNTVPKEGYLHSKQEDFYLSMFDHELSRKLATAGGIGIGDMLYEQLKTQLVQKSQAAAPGVPVEIKPLPEETRERLQANAEKQQDAVAPSALNPAALSRAELLRKIDDLAQEIEMNDQARVGAMRSPLPHIAWPVEGETVSRFGFSAPTERLPRGSNSGIEIAAPASSGVMACLDGLVTAVEYRPGMGIVVEIEHDNGLRSVYGQLESAQVRTGQRVSTGREIARLPLENGKNVPRLYFEIRQGNIALNPELLRTA